MKSKSILFIIFFSLLIAQILITPQNCISYTILGSKLFFNSVFPSLFPFLVISNMIIGFDGIKIYSKAFGSILCSPLRLPKESSIALCISFLCGYPLGAKYSCSLYEKNLIDYKTCERLLNIASNPSPLFVVGVVGTSMLHNTYLGYILLASTYISCYLVSFFIPSTKIDKSLTITSNLKPNTTSLGIIMKESIENAVSTTLYVGAYIIFFFVISSIIKNNALFSIVIKNNLIKGMVLGILEMTNGCYLISSVNYNIYILITIISFLMTFSGISVIAQVHSITYKYNFNLGTYIKYKFLQGVLSSLVTYCFLSISYKHTSSTFFCNTKNINLTGDIFICLSIILVVPFIFHITKKLFNIS